MARQKGIIKLKGTIGDITFYKTQDGHLAREKGGIEATKTGVIKRCMFTATANNLLLFTNYNGDPEVAAAGSGSVGSSSVGIDYCGVPVTAGFSFGVNLTF